MSTPSLLDRMKLRMRCINLAVKMTHRGIAVHEENRRALIGPAQEKLELYRDLSRDAAAALGWSRHEAVFSHWEDHPSEMTKQKKPKRIRVYKQEPVHFNAGSTHQWTALLVDQLKMTPLAYTDTGAPCWDAEVLEKLKSSRNPKLRRLAEVGVKFKEVQKELGTYLEGLPVHPNGRIHPMWAAMNANTLRWTSDGPNAQNLPKHLRSILTHSWHRETLLGGGAGWTRGFLLETDHSQQELRTIALLSGCKRLLSAYAASQDVHRLNASAMFGVDPKDVSADMRDISKPATFGMCYRATVATMLSVFHSDERFKHVTYGMLEKMVESFFSQHPEIRAYHYRMEDMARKGKIVEALSGHELVTCGVVDPALNANFPVQTAGAKMMADALLEVDSKFDPSYQAILGNNHDAMLYECGSDDFSETMGIVVDAMEKVHTLNGNSLKYLSETKVSASSWGESIEVKNSGELVVKNGAGGDHAASRKKAWAAFGPCLEAA
jgi:DNA polymerase-1